MSMDSYELLELMRQAEALRTKYAAVFGGGNATTQLAHMVERLAAHLAAKEQEQERR